ncbi:MAG: DUF3810 domain-containing protein [Coprobacillus sp.]|nr:DUF3810 domain-containing protein [Coprobacillus sp.]
MKWIKKNLYFFVELMVTLFFGIILLVSSLIKLNTDASEWWTLHISYWFQKIFAPLNRLIPFSLTEILIAAFVIVIIVLLVFGIIKLCKRRWKKGLHLFMWIAILGVAVGALYQGTAGVAYSRKSIPFTFADTETLTEDDYYAIGQYFVDDFNYCSSKLEYTEEGDVISPYTFSELNDLLIDDYMQYESSYLYDDIYPTKEMMWSWLFCEFNVTGMYFSLSTESIINMKQPTSDMPFTMLHELSHSRGVMREYDAQLMATFVSLQSKDPYVRYSGYLATFYSLQNMIVATCGGAKWNELYYQLNDNILANYTYRTDFWAQYHILDDIADWFNDLYLRIFGNEGGTGSYVDPGSSTNPSTGKVVLSTYQKMYVSVYYDELGIE